MAAKGKRVAVMEAQLVASSEAYARELTAMQARVVELETAAARADSGAAALGAAVHSQVTRAAEEAGARYAGGRGFQQYPPPPQRGGSAGSARVGDAASGGGGGGGGAALAHTGRQQHHAQRSRPATGASQQRREHTAAEQLDADLANIDTLLNALH